MVEHAPEERGVGCSIHPFGTMNFFSARFQTIADFFKFQQFPTDWWAGIFSWTYWTDSNLTANSPYFLFFLVVTLLIIGSLVSWQRHLKELQKKVPVYKPVINQIPSIITIIVVMAAFYWFFRAQQIALFSSRLTILITFLVVLGWVSYLIIYLRRTVPAKRAYYLEKERFFRYLPKKKP